MNRRRFLTQTAAATIAGAGYLATQSKGIANESPDAKIRVGFIGTGHPHAPKKVATIRDLHDVFELVGVVEPNTTLRESAQTKPEYDNVHWITEDQLFSTEGLQAVLVESEFDGLLPAAVRCVAHNLQVHLDKPPGKSLDQLSKLLSDARSRGVHVQMGYMFRYNPAFELCYRAAREGWLGRIFELDTTISKLHSRERRKGLGMPKGGAMFDLGCHVIDSLVTVLGPPQKVTPFSRSLHSDEDSVVDSQLAVFEYPSAIATVRASFVEPEANTRRQFVVCGENGTLEIRPLEPPRVRLALDRPAGGFNAGEQTVELPPMPGRYHAQLLDFAAVVQGRAKPRWSSEHDLAVQRALLQASNLAEST